MLGTGYLNHSEASTIRPLTRHVDLIRDPPVARNRVRWTRTGWTVVSALATLLFHACSHETSASRPPRDIGPLQALERIAYGELHIREGPATQAFDGVDRFPLYPYYLGANGDLVDLVAKVSGREIKNLVACIVAPAGFGKSPLIDYLRRKVFEDAVLIDLKEAVTSLEEREKKPDLVVQRDGETLLLNELPHCASGLSTGIFVRIEEEVLLIDSIDEVHPDTAKRFLDAIERDVQEAKAKARRRYAFLFGRAEGFGDYFSRSNDQSRKVLYLRFPEWRSVGDLQNLYRSFVSYTKKEYRDEVFQRIVHLTRKLPYVLDSMKSLSLAMFLMERAYSFPRFEEGDIRRAMYRAILDRSSRTHGRPTVGSLHGRIYQGLLRAVADKYAQRVEISPKESELGYFEVNSRDVVHLKTGESASVWTVLDRSGLAESRPIDRTMRKYRFAPLWLQRYLLEEVE